MSNLERYVDRRVSRPSIFWLAILLALLIHATSVYLVAPYLESIEEAEAKRRRSEPIEIVQAPSPQPRKPVVQTSRAQEQPEDNSTARFSGEFRNRVKKETQSANKSRFRDSKQTAQKQGRPSPKGPGAGPEHLQMSDLLPSYAGNPYAFSDDIAKGDSTQLNTDAVHYASFLNRIAEEVYDPWVRLVRDALAGSTGRRLASIDYVTRIEVVMDPKGKVITIKITKSCGIPELDEAARRAFLEVEPFRNPPKELIGETGDIRLAYGLQVQMGSSFFNISR